MLCCPIQRRQEFNFKIGGRELVQEKIWSNLLQDISSFVLPGEVYILHSTTLKPKISQPSQTFDEKMIYGIEWFQKQRSNRCSYGRIVICSMFLRASINRTVAIDWSTKHDNRHNFPFLFYSLFYCIFGKDAEFIHHYVASIFHVLWMFASTSLIRL